MTSALRPDHVLAYVAALTRRAPRSVLADGDVVLAGDADLLAVAREALGGREEAVGVPHPRGLLTAVRDGDRLLAVVCAGATPPAVTASDLRAALAAS